MADFDIPVEDFEALQAMVDAGDLSAAESRLRKLTKVSAEDARYFVQEMAGTKDGAEPVSPKKGSKSARSDFDIPVEDFKALRAMVDAGDLSAAESRFRELTKVSAKDARRVVQDMAEAKGGAEPVSPKKGSKGAKADFDIPVEDFKALQAMVDAGNLSAAENRFRKLTKVSADDARHFVREMAEGNGEMGAISKEKKPKGAEKERPEPEPVYTRVPLPVKGAPSSAATSSSPAATSFAAAPVKPPSTDDTADSGQLESAVAFDNDREGEAPDREGLRWHERMLPFLSIPLLWGGLVGASFCVLGFFVVLVILKSSLKSRLGRYTLAVLALLGSYTGYLATAVDVTGDFSLFGPKEEFTKPAPIEPSNTSDWVSPAASVVEGTDAELQQIFDLYYRPLDAFPPVSTSIEDATLTVVSEDVKVDSALTGVPLLDNEQDLVADFGRGFNVTLESYALRLPSDEPGSSLNYIHAEDPALEAKESSRPISASKHRKRPVLRCMVRLNRVSNDKLMFHLFDAQSRRSVSSAKPNRAGEVDFQLGIWHRTPLLMVVEADAWISSSATRLPLPSGEDVALGLGRTQLAYVGPGRLEGVENGATIECGKPYQLVGADNEELGGMVILRYSPPYLADSTSLLMIATKDHLVSSIPAFGDFELKPVGPDKNLLGFRVFHIPPTIDNQLQGQGLRLGNARASKADVPKIERTVDFASDRINASFESQRGRGLIAMDEVTGLQSAPESGNLFDLKIPLIVFEESHPLRLLLEFAADAVEFDLEEASDELKLPKFLDSVEYRDLTPRQALLDFEQLSGIRVIVDSDQRRIRLQP